MTEPVVPGDLPFVEVVAHAVNQLYELAQGYRNDWNEFDGRQLKCEIGEILDPVMAALELERARPALPAPEDYAAALREIAQLELNVRDARDALETVKANCSCGAAGRISVANVAVLPAVPAPPDPKEPQR